MLFLFIKKIEILLIFKDNGEGFLFNFYFVGIINISVIQVFSWLEWYYNKKSSVDREWPFLSIHIHSLQLG